MVYKYINNNATLLVAFLSTNVLISDLVTSVCIVYYVYYVMHKKHFLSLLGLFALHHVKCNVLLVLGDNRLLASQ